MSFIQQEGRKMSVELAEERGVFSNFEGSIYDTVDGMNSQIVGTQAVLNVLFGRYKMITEQVKDYCFGLYGQPPAEIAPEVRRLALEGYERGQVPVTCRPGDLLEPVMEQAASKTQGLAQDIGDVLIYALYPTTGLRFLKWKYGLEQPPAETRAKTIEDVRREDDLVAKARKGLLVEPGSAPSAAGPARSYRVRVDGEWYEVEVDETADAAGLPAMSVRPEAAPAAAPAVVAAAPAPSPAAKPRPSAGPVLTAPMPGLLVKYLVKPGDRVTTGTPVLVLEAMKMQNNVCAPLDARVAALVSTPGENVNHGDVLIRFDA
jgi:biotin carboxyl carrier protein